MGHDIPRAGGFIEPPATVGGTSRPVTPEPVGVPQNEAAYLEYRRTQSKRDRIRALWAEPVNIIRQAASYSGIDISQFGTASALVEAIADAEYPPMSLPLSRKPGA